MIYLHLLPPEIILKIMLAYLNPYDLTLSPPPQASTASVNSIVLVTQEQLITTNTCMFLEKAILKTYISPHCKVCCISYQVHIIATQNSRNDFNSKVLSSAI